MQASDIGPRPRSHVAVYQELTLGDGNVEKLVRKRG
jgi:hypothetical protein